MLQQIHHLKEVFIILPFYNQAAFKPCNEPEHLAAEPKPADDNEISDLPHLLPTFTLTSSTFSSKSGSNPFSSLTFSFTFSSLTFSSLTFSYTFSSLTLPRSFCCKIWQQRGKLIWWRG